MALIVEDGTALPNAESYISVADADAYFAARNDSTWGPLATGVKEGLLRQATEYMMGAYRSRWLGYRTTSTQALDWPRAEVRIPDAPRGYGSFAAYVPNNVVPVEVKRACAELALQANASELAPNLERSTLREKVDVIEVEYDPDAPDYTRYRQVDMMLSPYLNSGAAMAKVVRT